MAYIGSRISLVSKSDLRYDGILTEINQADSTVTLRDVTCFGSEGRKGIPSLEVPPAAQIFAEIVFRGSDVKDLTVMTQAEPSALDMPNDPAIISSQSKPAPSPPGFAYKEDNREPQQNDFHTHSQSNQQVKSSAQPVHFGQTNNYHKQDRKGAHPREHGHDSHRGYQRNTKSSPRNVVTAEDDLVKKMDNVKIDQSAPDSESNNRETGKALQVNANGEPTSRDVQPKFHERSQGPRSIPGTGAHLLHSNYRNRGGRGRHRGSGNPRGGQIMHLPDTDFDFETSNAKFNKDDVAGEVATKTTDSVDTAPATPSTAAMPESDQVAAVPTEGESADGDEPAFYKKSSFFDDISCESKDRASGERSGNRRAHQFEERRLNLETFGQTGMGDGRNGYRRGGHRGGSSGGHRGGHRGYRGSYF